MNRLLRLVSMLLIPVFLFGVLLVTGCAPKKPEPQRKLSPQKTGVHTPVRKPVAPVTPKPSTPAPNTQTLTKAAKKVKGVRNAYVVMNGTNAFVAIQVKNTKPAANNDKMKSEVAAAVKKADPAITNVSVTMDPALYTKIRDMARSITAGKPLTTIQQDLTDIANKLKPVS